MSDLFVSVIVAVYKDSVALNCIFDALNLQTYRNFEVLVAEDGRDGSIQEICQIVQKYFFPVRHLNQDDIGFRKTTAVNRAIKASSGEYLVFLDGDCIPHEDFINNHVRDSEKNFFCAGRRMHLGPKWSSLVRNDLNYLKRLSSYYHLIFNLYSLLKDSSRNIELALPSDFLRIIFINKSIDIIGCNFSCYKEDIYKINGYDEDLTGIGGEDADLTWRALGYGLSIKSVKYSACVYHLFHSQNREGSSQNIVKSRKNIDDGVFFCKNGIVKPNSDYAAP